jgi:hypothetical protein
VVRNKKIIWNRSYRIQNKLKESLLYNNTSHFSLYFCRHRKNLLEYCNEQSPRNLHQSWRYPAMRPINSRKHELILMTNKFYNLSLIKRQFYSRSKWDQLISQRMHISCFGKISKLRFNAMYLRYGKKWNLS